MSRIENRDDTFLKESFARWMMSSHGYSDLQKRDAVERLYQGAIRYGVDA